MAEATTAMMQKKIMTTELKTRCHALMTCYNINKSSYAIVAIAVAQAAQRHPPPSALPPPA